MYLLFTALKHWPLCNMGLNLCRFNYIQFFFQHTVIPSYQQILLKNWKHYFWSTVGTLWVWNTNCMHWSMPFYIRDLNICTQESYNHGYPGMTEVSGESMIICGFSTAWRLAPLTPTFFFVHGLTVVSVRNS